MDMTGEYRINAPREKVWAALNDPDMLKQCIPGCESIEKTSDTSFTAEVVAKVGPVKAKFSGNVTISDIDPPNGYTISGEGKGGAAGFASGGAKVTLATDGPTTVLSYDVNAKVGGKLAQIGSRLIDSTARKMADEFFGRFAELVAGPSPDAAPSPSIPEASPTAPAIDQAMPPSPTPPGAPVKGLPTYVWVGALIALAAILLFVFGRN